MIDLLEAEATFTEATIRAEAAHELVVKLARRIVNDPLASDAEVVRKASPIALAAATEAAGEKGV